MGPRLRALVLTGLVVAGLSAAVAGKASPMRAAEPSPCRISSRVLLSDKLVCPFDSVDAQIRIQASCPEEADGRARVVSLLVRNPLPGGVRHAGSSGPYVEESTVAAWHIEPFPRNGVTLTQRIRPIFPGAYAIGSELSFRLVDDRDREAEALAAGPADPDKNLSVPANCAGQRRSSVYLPILHQPRCTPLRQPADIVLAIDRSTSMGSARAGAAQAETLLDMFDLRRDRLAVLAFDQRVETIAALGSDRDRLLAALVGLSPAAGTSIDRAIQAGSALLAGSTGRRRIVILVTDGVQTGPRGRGSALAAADVATRGGLSIMAVAVGPAPDFDLLESIATAGLVRAGKIEELGPAYRALGELAACTR